MFVLIVSIVAIAMVIYMAIAAMTVTTNAEGELVMTGTPETHSSSTVSTTPGATGSRATTDEF
jgi:hypothetical protein